MPENDDEPTIPKYPPGLKTRGKRLWDELHETADFSDCPETQFIAEELLTVSLDDDGDVIGVDEDPMMRMAPLGMVSGAVVGVVAVLPSG